MPVLRTSFYIGIALFVFGFAGGFSFAQINTEHVGGAHQNHDIGATPTESGQSAFAAIAEIVKLLEGDPETDWSEIDITALWNHLLDMSNLTLGSSVRMEAEGMQVRFLVTGSPAVVQAARNMVPTHAKELDKMSEWSASGEPMAGGAKLTITAQTQEVLTKITALGFFGLMATGAHHQPHHLEMARGKSMNH